jgi:hypothetical protein
LVQEGTPFQRPAIPGVNDRASRGKVNATQATEAWEKLETGKRGQVAKRTILSKPSTPTRSKLPSRTQTDIDKEVSKPGQSGMRARVSTARTQRQVDGLASRSSASKKRSIKKAIPGRDKVGDKDGEIWDSLTDEQKDLVKKQAEQAYQDLMDEIKQKDSDWWQDFLQQNARLKGSRKIDSDGNEWNKDSRIAGEAFTSYQLEIEDVIDEMKIELSSIRSQIAATSDPEAKKKLENKEKRLSKEIDRAQTVIDDLLTFDQMKKIDDWSLLEHLHPESRQKIFGVKVPKAQQGQYEKVFGDSKSPIKLNEPSSIFEKDLTRPKPLLGERTDRKLADLARRITRPNPERAERRRLRKEGKGKTKGQDDARDKVSRVKRRIAKAKRDIKKTIRGKRNQDQVQNDVDNARKNSKTLIKRDKDNNPVVDASTIERFQKLLVGYKPSELKKKEKSGKGKNADSFLGQIWDSQGFSALPTAVTKAEAEELIAQGWIPIQRGHGGESKNEATQFAEEYIFDPLRYITGEGGQAVGPGEYWGHPESRGWDSWIDPQSKNIGTIAMLSPKTKIISESDAEKLKRDGDTIADAVNGYLTGAGSGGKAESLDPADLVRELKAHLATVLPSDSSVWSTEVGKVYSQIFSLMEAGDTSEAKQLYNALKFMSKQTDSHRNIYAMILGYDGIDYGKSDGRLLIFNRASLAVMDNPIELKEIKEISSGIRKATPTKTKKPARGSSDSSTKVKGSSKSLDNQSWKQVGGQGGSQPGAEFEDPSGKKFYVKKQKSKLHAENEVLMSKLYEKLGVRAAKNSEGTAHISNNSPGPGVFSEWLDGSKSVNHSVEVKNPKWKKSVQDTFVTSAWLANWDGTGNGDNIKMGADGEAYIIDTGGAGLFRARGDSKGVAFGSIVGEMESLRDPRVNSLGAMYFSDIPAQEIARQVAAIGALSDAEIIQMVNSVITDSVEAKKMADTLMARRDYLVQTWGTGSRK